MKILQVTPRFVPSKLNGIKLFSYNISKLLAKKGHDVTVYIRRASLRKSAALTQGYRLARIWTCLLG